MNYAFICFDIVINKTLKVYYPYGMDSRSPGHELADSFACVGNVYQKAQSHALYWVTSQLQRNYTMKPKYTQLYRWSAPNMYNGIVLEVSYEKRFKQLHWFPVTRKVILKNQNSLLGNLLF